MELLVKKSLPKSLYDRKIDGYLVSMNRKKLAQASILLFLVSTLAEASLVMQATANPFWISYLPYGSPVRDPPIISVQSLVSGQTYGSDNSVYLNYSVIKPDSWFNFRNMLGSTSSGISCGLISRVRYELDANPNQTYLSQSIPVNDWWGSKVQGNSPKFLNFSLHLTVLTEEQHTITISAEGQTYYLPANDTERYLYNPPSITIDSLLTTISFNFPEPLSPSISQKDPPPRPTPLPSPSPSPTIAPTPIASTITPQPASSPTVSPSQNPSLLPKPSQIQSQSGFLRSNLYYCELIFAVMVAVTFTVIGLLLHFMKRRHPQTNPHPNGNNG